MFNICAASEYGKREGFVIEKQFWNGESPMFAIPAWDEMNMPDCAGVFETRDQAIYKLAEYGISV